MRAKFSIVSCRYWPHATDRRASVPPCSLLYHIPVTFARYNAAVKVDEGPPLHIRFATPPPCEAGYLSFSPFLILFPFHYEKRCSVPPEAALFVVFQYAVAGHALIRSVPHPARAARPAAP